MLAGSFDLAIDEVPGPLEVHSFQGSEELSHAWRFDIVVSGALEHDMERVALGQRATVTLHLSGRSRVLHGVVARVALEERLIVHGRASFRVRIVPRLAMLELTKRSRVFQDMSVPEIVAAVLGNAGIAIRLALRRIHPKRAYCTQYDETDYDFIRRLLAEDGIYLYFYGGAAASAAADALGVAATVAGGVLGAAASALVPGDSIVCADSADFYPAIAADDPFSLAASTAAALAMSASAAGEVAGVASALTARDRTPFVMTFVPHDRSAASVYDAIWGFGVTNQVRSTGAMFRDYDPDRPLVRLQSVAHGTEPFAPSVADRAASALAAGVNAASAVMAGAGVNDEAPGVVGAVENAIGKAEELASRLGALANRQVYEHHSPFLFPKWEVARDEAPLLLQQRRRRASVAHGEGGCQDFSPGHQFELQGHQISTLDGSWTVTKVTHEGNAHDPNERHYVNRFECVPATVHYPPKRPPRTSVQVALTATVVGPPGEDIHTDDKGRIKVQFHWDREGTFDGYSSCWIRVMHPWAGAGWGHQFIPRVGMEALIVFDGGDPDKPLAVGSYYNGTHPHPFAVPGDKTRSGVRTQSTPGGEGYNELSFEDGAGREEILVHAQRRMKEEIGTDRITDIGNDEIAKVGRARTLWVGANLQEEVQGDRHSFVKGTRYDSVKGTAVECIVGDLALKVLGGASMEVGVPERPRTADTFIHGSAELGASERIQVRAEQGIQFVCGNSLIDIGPECITITSKDIRIDGSKAVQVRGNGPFLTLSDEVELAGDPLRLTSSKASLELDTDAKLDGQQVKLNCKGVSAHADRHGTKPATKKLRVLLSDEQFGILGGKEYILVTAGARFEGTTDDSGRLDIDIPAEAETAGLTVYIGKRPKGRHLQYRLRLAGLKPPESVRGVKERLENLGYYWGKLDDELDSIARSAIRAFQQDFTLSQTGEPDQATIAKLAEIARR